MFDNTLATLFKVEEDIQQTKKNENNPKPALVFANQSANPDRSRDKFFGRHPSQDIKEYNEKVELQSPSC